MVLLWSVLLGEVALSLYCDKVIETRDNGMFHVKHSFAPFGDEMGLLEGVTVRTCA